MVIHRLILLICRCSLEYRGKLAEELKRADAVVLTYACDQPLTLNRLSTFWLHELRRLEVRMFVLLLDEVIGLSFCNGEAISMSYCFLLSLSILID